jgi:hypothetical protein
MKICRLLFLFFAYVGHLTFAQKKNPPNRIEKLPGKESWAVFVNNKYFTTLVQTRSVKKPVLFPVQSTSGHIVTRGFPLEPRANERIDHPHHVGVWFNHGAVNKHDFWNNSDAISKEHKGPFGKIVLKDVYDIRNGKNATAMTTRSEWVNEDGIVLLEEITQYRFYEKGKRRFIERNTTLKALGDTVHFKDNKEGMFAIRLCRALEQPYETPEILTDEKGVSMPSPTINNTGVTGKYLNSNKLEGDSVWGKPANWVAMRGKINNQKVQVAIYNHPKNPGQPAYWHARGYGLFGVNPLGAKAYESTAEEKFFTILPGKSLSFRFLLTVAESDDDSLELFEQIYKEWLKR